MCSNARLLLGGSHARQLDIHPLSAFDVAESFDADFAVFDVSVRRICARIELAAVFGFRLFDSGLVISDFVAGQQRRERFASWCFCLGVLVCGALGEFRTAAQRLVSEWKFEAWRIVRLTSREAPHLASSNLNNPINLTGW